MLQIKLKRNIKVIEMTLLAKVSIDVERKDLKRLLEVLKKDKNQILNNHRLLSMLKKDNLLDDHQELTETAKYLEETGFLKSDERGIYKIWYIQQDQLLPTIPIAIKREGWDYKSQSNIPEINFKDSLEFRGIKKIALISDENQKPIHQNIYKIIPQCPMNMPKEYTSFKIDFDMELMPRKENNLIHYLIHGKLKLDKVAPIDFEEKGSITKKIYPDIFKSTQLIWSENDFAILRKEPFSSRDLGFDDSEQLESFRVKSLIRKTVDTDFGQFEEIVFNMLSMVPENEEYAKQWHITWLKDLYEKTYYSHLKDILEQQNLFLSQKAMKKFMLSPYQASELFSIFDREKDFSAYAHNACLYDLLPDTYENVVSNHYLKKPGELFDFDNIQTQFANGEKVKHMLISDRYYKKQHKIILEGFNRSLDLQDSVLLCLHTPEVPENWKYHIVQRDKENHQRLWIFITETKKYCWIIDHSLDFLKIPSDAAFSDSFKVEHRVSFQQTKELTNEIQKHVDLLLNQISHDDLIEIDFVNDDIDNDVE